MDKQRMRILIKEYDLRIHQARNKREVQAILDEEANALLLEINRKTKSANDKLILLDQIKDCFYDVVYQENIEKYEQLAEYLKIKIMQEGSRARSR